jgi:electron transfer flavoprotein alpha subunit
VSIGAGGKFNHMIGVRAAGTVLAINPDATAPIFQASDAGIVGEWRDVVPLLLAELETKVP